MFTSTNMDTPEPKVFKEETAMQLTPFHVAVQVRDINEARDFYGVTLGFSEGRSAEAWIDFNMFGHQFVTHLNPQLGKTGTILNISNSVDGHGVPVPHCGVVLDFAEWEVFAEKVSACIDDFIIEPYVRFKGEPGEQGTMFFSDPSGNALEFKAFRNIEQELFTR
jgi:extradiol dioxygenase family protein